MTQTHQKVSLLRSPAKHKAAEEEHDIFKINTECKLQDIMGLAAKKNMSSFSPSTPDINKFILISYDQYDEYNCLLIETLDFFLVNKFCMIFVCLSKPFNQYNVCFERQGSKVENLKECGRLAVIDGMELFRNLIDEYVQGSVSSDNPLSILYNADQTHKLKPLYDKVCLEISRLKHKDKMALPCESKGVLIIDDINILLNIGIPCTAVLDFVQYCRREVRASYDDGNIVIKMNLIGKDEETTRFLTLLGHLADVNLSLVASKDKSVTKDGIIVLTSRRWNEVCRQVITMDYKIDGMYLKIVE